MGTIMRNRTTIQNALSALSLIVLLGGCQGIQLAGKPTQLDNAAFMNLWDAYRHCQASTDVDTMQADVRQLTRAALTQESAKDLAIPLPDFVKRVVARLESRLAVDPKAMTAACALSTGQAALRAERMDLAAEMFQTVLRNHPKQEYAYYVEQAQAGMEDVTRGARAAVHTTDGAPILIPISSAAPTLLSSALPSFED